MAELSWGRGSAPGHFKGWEGEGAECHGLCGTWARRINTDVAVDRTILGFGGYPGGDWGLRVAGRGVPSRWRGGGASSQLPAGAGKREGWPYRSCSGKKCRQGRPHAASRPPPARTPSPAGCRHALALPPPAGPPRRRHPRIPKGPASESEVSATAPVRRGKLRHGVVGTGGRKRLACGWTDGWEEGQHLYLSGPCAPKTQGAGDPHGGSQNSAALLEIGESGFY